MCTVWFGDDDNNAHSYYDNMNPHSVKTAVRGYRC